MQAQVGFSKLARKSTKIKKAFMAMLASTMIITAAPSFTSANTISKACLHYAEAKRFNIMKGNSMYVKYAPKFEHIPNERLKDLLRQDRIADYKYMVEARRALIKESGENAVETCEKAVGLAQEIKMSEKKMEVSKLLIDKNKDMWKDVLRTIGVIAFIYFLSLAFRP